MWLGSPGRELPAGETTTLTRSLAAAKAAAATPAAGTWGVRELAAEAVLIFLIETLMLCYAGAYFAVPVVRTSRLLS